MSVPRGWGRPAASQGCESLHPTDGQPGGMSSGAALILIPWQLSQQQPREPGTWLGDVGTWSQGPCCSFWGSIELRGFNPGVGFWSAVLSSEPGVCGAVRLGMAVWEGGMIQRRENGASFMDLASAVPWRETGAAGGARCIGLSYPKFSSPNSPKQRTTSSSSSPRVRCSLCRRLGWSPEAASSPSAPSFPAAGISAKQWLCHPESCSSRSCQGAEEGVWHVRVLGDVGQGLAFVTAGKVVMVWRRCCLC